MADATREAIDKAQEFFAAMEEAIDRGDREEAERQFEQGWFWLQSAPDNWWTYDPSAPADKEQR